MKNAAEEKIIETQEESEEDDETIFTFFVDGEIVSWAKTLLYSYLEEIHTARNEKCKGFGQKLLSHLEKNAKAHGANKMRIRCGAFCSEEERGFLRSMGYECKPIENGATRFLEVTKNL